MLNQDSLADLEIGHIFLSNAQDKLSNAGVGSTNANGDLMRTESLANTPGSRIGPSDTLLYGALFASAVLAFCLARLFGNQFGGTYIFVAIVGDATCGWSWLLVRALFRKPTARPEVWPLALVLVLVAVGAYLRVYGGSDSASPLPRILANVETLISSTLLLLAAAEPLTGLSRDIAPAERRFRVLFAAGYVGLLAVAVLWINGAPHGSISEVWSGWIKAGCAMLALCGMALAITYRIRNPLAEPGRPKRQAPCGVPGELDIRLLGLMQADAAYRRPELRVADLARSAGVAEYKVTQSITGPLGFRNFNHMTNHFRIDEARRKLADAQHDHLPILTIALDCGFGSIGPFNRAFKAETGMTPMQFRNGTRKDAAPVR